MHQQYKIKKNYKKINKWTNKIILCQPKIKVQIHETKNQNISHMQSNIKKCQFHANQYQILEPCNRKTNLNLNALEINRSQAKQSPMLKKLEITNHHAKDLQKVPQCISKENPKVVTERIAMDH